ncbi:hypothetical protein [Kribbella ginsengisoli]|uniref:Uncharacterized protein n=1 Tax=Kribbella ginsengisoli TaxID=363865 RepID=A0ABP6YR85_9ACTN
MSNSAFHLLQTGTDPADAEALVARLLDLNGSEQVRVELQLDTDSHAATRYFDLARIAQVQMEYVVPPEHAELIESLLVVDDRPRTGVPGADGVDLWVLPTDTKALEQLGELAPMPVSVHLYYRSARDFDWDVVSRIGESERAAVQWTDCWWRPVPEAGLPGDSKHAGVMLSVNSSGQWELIPAPPGFRLYVETREGTDGLARWLGAQVQRPILPE